MRAARLHTAGDLRVDEEPVPGAGQGMGLVRVAAVGICGSDLHWWDEGAIGGQSVASAEDIAHALVKYHPGDSISVTYVDQSGQSQTINLTLASGPTA